MQITKTAMFSIVGRPNVGKSTLLNALTGEKIAIVSAKPQTTRNRISGIVNRAGVQYIFMDTPGFHKPKNKLGDYMVGVVHETVSDTDAAILVVEPRAPGRQEQMLTREIAEQGLSCVLVINKIDTCLLYTSVEQHPGAGVCEHARAHHAENKGGAGVIAEGEHPLALRFGAQPALVGRDRGARADRIAADNAHDEGAGAGAV